MKWPLIQTNRHMINKGLFTSNTPEWETPQDLFWDLHKEFKFTIDVCATKDNRKIGRHYDKETDGLKQNWTGEVCWMNPPYGREIGKWIKKASEVQGGGSGCFAPCPD